MSWEENLLDASFKGVPLQIQMIEDCGGHDVVRHLFPGRDGQETEDQGSRAQEIRVAAICYGEDYEAELERLLDALDDDGPGELVHPVFGSLIVQVLDWRTRHQADEVDQCRIDIFFAETDEPRPIFEHISPRQAAATAADSDLAVSMAASEAYVADMAEPSLRSQLAGLRATLRATISEIYGTARDVVSSGLDVINFPRLCATDLVQGAEALLRLPEAILPGRIANQWRSVADDARALRTLPSRIAARQKNPPPVIAMRPVNRLMATVAVSQYAATVGELLAAEAAQATLSPAQVEAIVGDVRGQINEVIIELRGSDLSTAEAVERYRPVIEALKTQALVVQQAGQAIIELRPPLITRPAPVSGNLRLIAHIWYADHARADELLRLNPQIRQPNFVRAGQPLLGYAA